MLPRLNTDCMSRLSDTERTESLIWTGPHRLDLGDILYAPNTLQTPDGRTLLLAWLQELRRGGGFDYAGCLSIPRELSLQGAHSNPEL